MNSENLTNKIAVIGMACRFPGAQNADIFWENLKNGIESISYFSNQDLKESGIAPLIYNQPEYVRKGFIIDDEDKFDAAFFGYSPREAENMDPQHRLFLETAWKALEDGGYPPGQCDAPVGVFAGSKISTYLLNLINGQQSMYGAVAGYQTLIGNDKDYLATRVSYKLNLKGPSVTVQSACSTSLLAVHFACESLLSGECDMALAGGVAISVPQKTGYLYQEGMVISPDGHCRAFDEQAKGMSPGNGVGIVLLKELEKAIQDKDHIYAVIRGTAANNDGSDKTGFTTPSVEGQAKVIREAISIAEVDCESISYLETHGTGTEIGDPIEIEAVTEVFRAETDKRGFCAIGSLKTNIGHLDTAAGVASLIKTVLSLKHAQIPPSLNYSKPNPKINFETTPFFVNTQLSEWQTNGLPRRAGVSCFGFGGTNVHAILEEAPQRNFQTHNATHPFHLLTLSAKTPQALKQQIQNYHLFLGKNNYLSVEDICFTANTGRPHLKYRFASVCSSFDDLRQQLASATKGEQSTTLFEGVADNRIEPEVSFDFSGQSFESEQIANISYSSHVLKSHYRLPLERENKDNYLSILSVLGQLFVKGANIDWEAFYHDGTPYRVPLPTYPFEKQRHWVTSTNKECENSPDKSALHENIDEIISWDSVVAEGKLQAANVFFDLKKYITYKKNVFSLCSFYIISTLESLELFTKADDEYSIESLIDQANILPKYKQLISRFLKTLTSSGELSRQEDHYSNLKHTESDSIDRFIEKIETTYPEYGEWTKLVSLCGKNLGEILQGRVNPLEILFPKGSIEMIESVYQNDDSTKYLNSIIVGIVKKISQTLPKSICLRILEIGAGTGSTTGAILERIQSNDVHYCFTDISPKFLNHARKKFSQYSFVEYKILNIESPPEDQSFEAHGYDVIIAANVLHATRDLNMVMDNVRSLLAPNGILVLREITSPHVNFDLIFGPVLNILVDEELRKGQPFLSKEKWYDLLESKGFVRTEAFSTDTERLGEHIIVSQLTSMSQSGVDTHAFRREKGLYQSLAGQRLTFPFPVFEIELDIESIGVIKHHRIDDVIILPGAAFFEMAVRAGEQIFSTENVRLKDITLHHALTIPEDGARKTIQIILDLNKFAGKSTFQIFSLGEEEKSSWQLHVTGSVQPVETENEDLTHVRPLLTEIKEKICKTGNLVKATNKSEDIFLIEDIWRDQQEIFARLSISNEDIEACRNYRIHPLVMNPVMMALRQAFQHELNESGKDAIYLPVKAGRINRYGRLTSQLWCHMEIHSDGIPSDDFYFDCRLFDQDGDCIAELMDIYVHRASHKPFQQRKPLLNKMYYKIDWQPDLLPREPEHIGKSNETDSPEKWVVFADHGGAGKRLAKLLGAQGKTCIQIYMGSGFAQLKDNTYTIMPKSYEDYNQVFRTITRDASKFGIIHLWSLDALLTEDQPLARLEEIETEGCGSLFYIVKSLVEKYNISAKLCIITQSVHPINGNTSQISVAQAPIIGLTKVLAKELPELNCLSIDIDSLNTEADCLQVIEAMQRVGLDNEVAFRKGERYTPRLVNCFPKVKEEQINFDSLGLFLITGAFGGLGLEVARWLAENGVRYLLLIGRNEPDANVLANIEKLEETGVQIFMIIADVSDYSMFSSKLNEALHNMPPLKGVFHLAGILKGDMILHQDYEEFGEVMDPKVKGAWNLHLLTQDLSLDFFVLFSTSSTLWGIQGVGSYTAANMFLDSLAHYRKKQGLPALSINWGTWAKIGAAAKLNMEDRLSAQGLNSIPPEKCLACLTELLQSNICQTGVLDVDWDTFLGRFPKHVKPSLFRELETSLFSSPSIKKTAINLEVKNLPSLDQLLKLSVYEQQTLLCAYLRNEISRILKIQEKNIKYDQNLIELGMDSLIFIELSQILRKDLKIEIAPHKVFENPSISAMSRQLVGDMALEKRIAVLDDKAMPDFVITHDIANRYEPFELTDIQYAYWIGRNATLELGNIACHVYMEIDAVHLDFASYSRAWQIMIKRHEMLRAVVLPEGTQKILETVSDYRIEVSDLTKKTSNQADIALRSMRDKMSHQVLNPETWPLFDIKISRINSEISRIHLSFDMLIVDALSVSQLMQELNRLYQNENTSLQPLNLSFRDYVHAKKQFEKSALFQQSKEYWMERLETIPPGPELPLKIKPSEVRRPQFSRRTLKLGADTWRKLKTKAAKAGLTPSGILLACYAEILSLWSKTPRFTINMTIFNRLPVHAQVNDIIGDFTSLIMLVVDNTENRIFIERAQQIQQQFWRDVEHRHFSGVRVLRELSRMRKSGTISMPVVFTSNIVYGDLEEIASEAPEINDIVYTVTQTPQVWLDHQITEQGNALKLDWDAVDELFPEGVLDDMFYTYHLLLNRIASSDDAWHARIFELLPEHQAAFLKKANVADIPVPNILLHTLFADQADRIPEKDALITTEKRMSYKELALWAKLIGQRLRSIGIKPNELVAVVMDKGWEQIPAVLGVLYSGAAYLPVDPTVPKERLRHLLKDGDVRVVLTQSWLNQKLGWPHDVECLPVDSFSLAAEEEFVELDFMQTPNDLAYVIYTSGSTGIPKGVMIDHKSAVNTILDINERFHLSSEDKVFALSNLNFDLSVYDIFGILAVGATIVIPDHKGANDPDHWLNWINSEGITVWNTVPQFMQMLTEYIANRNSCLSDSLRLIMMSGDWIPLDLPQKIRSNFQNAEIYSLGGATEASIWSICYPVKKIDPGWKSIPYGKAMKNQKVFVLNQNYDVCPTWVTGDLFIGGAGLARGYWKDREKTDASFVAHPKTKERLYKTGDLGRYLPDGNIEFLGREDLQVKINGYRIECGEIESALKQLPGVKNTVVVVTDGPSMEKQLLGCVIPNDKADSILFDYRDVDPADCASRWESVRSTGKRQASQIPSSIDIEAVPDFINTIEQLSFVIICQILYGMGIFSSQREEYTIDELMQRFRIQPRFQTLFRHWLHVLQEEGVIEKTEAGSYLNYQPLNEERHFNTSKLPKDLKGLYSTLQYHIPLYIDLLKGKIEPIELLLTEDTFLTAERLEQIDPGREYYLNLAGAIFTTIVDSLPSDRHVRVLEVGTRAGNLTETLLSLLPIERGSYLYADESFVFTDKMREKVGDKSSLELSLLDMNKAPGVQGYESHTFDVIIADKALHRARHLEKTLKHVKELLVPGGLLLLVEPTQNNRLMLITVGLFEDGFSHFEDERKNRRLPFIPVEKWHTILEKTGFSRILTFPEGGQTAGVFGQHLVVAQAPERARIFKPSNISDALQQKLPGYMVPARYMLLDELPLSTNMKIDRKALAKIVKETGPQSDKTYVAPFTEIQINIARILEEMLGNVRVGIHDNFFELGGDSLRAIQCINLLKAAYPVELSLKEFFEESNVERLARKIEEKLEIEIKLETEEGMI